jgi:hypothetical protein
MMTPRAWSFLIVEGTRQYGGNDGYNDSPAETYRYDSDVANHLKVAEGDVAIIRTRDHVKGVAVIEQIVPGEGKKERLRCPICSATNIKRRATLQPEWRCKSQHTFDQPKRQWDTVSTYEAHYANTFQSGGAGLSVDDVHRAVIRPSDQMSIKEIDLSRLEKALIAVPLLKPILTGYARRLSPEPERPYEDNEVGTIIEARRTVLREISVRRGQPQFRNRLIARYGMQCQISGSAFPGLVEAAHIRPYAMSSDNSVTNGLLLRSDLHTLFDLGMLLIDPQTLKIKIDARLLGCGYDGFEGAGLILNGTIGPDKNALRDRWQFFEGCSSK